MHPVIRVLIVIAFAIHVTRIDLSELFIALLMLTAFALIGHGVNLTTAWRFLQRLPWLFLVIPLFMGAV